MSLADRLRAMLIERGLSQGELARRVGVTQGTIYKIVSGHAKSSKRIVEIAQSLGVRAEWLLTGNGEQYLDDGVPSNSYPSGQANRKISEGSSVVIREKDNQLVIPLLPDIESAFSSLPFPFSEYSGPTMEINLEDLKGSLVDASQADLIAFVVKGDSMDPVLPEGSKVIVNVNDHKVIDGKVYVLDQSDWKRIRTLYRSGPAELTMKTFNAASYPEEKIPMNDLTILGRIIFAQRTL